MSDSASNPDGTQLEDWCCDELDQPLDSDADTERISTPEFWAALADREDLEDSQSLEQLQLDPGALNATANSLDSFGTARIGSPANQHEESEQKPKQGNVDKIESVNPGVVNTHSKSWNTVPEKTLETGKHVQHNFSYDPCHVNSLGYTLSDKKAESMYRTRILGKTEMELGSSVPTDIGDALAEIYGHRDYCRQNDCLQAQAFWDEMQLPESTKSSNSKRSNQVQEKTEECRVTLRLYVPEMKKTTTLPKEFIVNQVIIRRGFSSRVPCSLENSPQDNTYFGRGAVVLSLEEEDPTVFVTFSPRRPRQIHGNISRTSRKVPDGMLIFEWAKPPQQKGANWRYDLTGEIAIEIYSRWPPLASNYEKQRSFFGDITLNYHSDTEDPRFFLASSSALSKTYLNPYTPALIQGIGPYSGAYSIASDTTALGGPASSGTGRLKRNFVPDSDQADPRGSNKWAKKGTNKT